MNTQQSVKANQTNLLAVLNCIVIFALINLTCRTTPAWAITKVMVQDFEKTSLSPTVWVVGIPNENASVQLSTDQAHEGKRSLKLHYQFAGDGSFQYLGIPNKVRILGPRQPNAFDTYMICPHAWEQGDDGKAIEKIAFDALHNPIRMSKFAIPSAWYEAFHTYGCKITKTDTIYYCDNIDVGRHKTLPLSKELPFFFLICLATGGGWPVDLSRYNGQADMYVDYVRVYSDTQ